MKIIETMLGVYTIAVSYTSLNNVGLHGLSSKDEDNIHCEDNVFFVRNY